MKVHPVFHTTLLRKFHQDPHGRVHPQPPAVITPEGEEEFIVQEILNSKKVGRKIYYFVKWEGYGVEHDSWEPKENLANAPANLKEFHRHHPKAVRP